MNIKNVKKLNIMSVNAMLRLSIPKKENFCSRNCLMKNVTSQDHSRCINKLEVSNPKLSAINMTNKKFAAPLPLSKSTTFEKKYKSIFAQREAEYDKNLKSIKVNLFSSMNSTSSLRTGNKSCDKSVTYRPNRMSVSQSLVFARRERSRTKTFNSSMQKSNATSRIIERSEESHKVSNFTGKKENDSFIANTGTYNNYATVNYQSFMRKEEEVEIDLSSFLKKNEEASNKKVEDKIELDLLNEKEDSQMLEIYMKDELIFTQKSDDKKITNVLDNTQGHSIGAMEEEPNINSIKTIKMIEEKIQSVKAKEEPSTGNNNLSTREMTGKFTNINIPTQDIEIKPKSFYTLDYFQDKINKINLGIFTLNYENLKTNKENSAKFSKEEYRKLLSTFFRFEYGKSILEEFHCEEEVNEVFLDRHQISERMRMKMVDWMIEVLSNYKCEENTYFLAVNILDRYFKLTSETLKPEDLHLLGICAMFISSKFHDVYPLKLKIVVEKVSHNKFSAEEIKHTEEKIMKTLKYQILKPTSFDFVNLFYEEIFFSIENNFTIEDNTLSNYLESFFSKNRVKFDFNYEKFRGSKKFNQKLLHLLMHVIIYLAKMNLHDYSLVGAKSSLLAGASIFVGIKICEQINNEEYSNDYFTKKICEVAKCSEYDLLHCAQRILHNAQNFDQIFTGLDNLKKVHFNYILSIK